jgi:ribA/ribD-fused uncharacterized protein
MAAGFPLWINAHRIGTSEALYQACRFPHLPEVQALILAERSPMTAKMRSKPYRKDSRDDWDRIRVGIMRWCLRAKLIQNWDHFLPLLEATGEKPIVEQSRKDVFWGAKKQEDGTLIGANVLGRLLMELRFEAASGAIPSLLPPPPVSHFLLMDEPIGYVAKHDNMESGALPREQRQTAMFIG